MHFVPIQPHCKSMPHPTLTCYMPLKAFFHPVPYHYMLRSFRKSKGEPWVVWRIWSIQLEVLHLCCFCAQSHANGLNLAADFTHFPSQSGR